MNKYQKAWKNIESLAGTSDYFEYKESSGDLRDLSVIQELVDKATPKEAIEKFPLNGDLYCPNCESCVYEFYMKREQCCSDCGQKIDWSVGDE